MLKTSRLFNYFNLHKMNAKKHMLICLFIFTSMAYVVGPSVNNCFKIWEIQHMKIVLEGLRLKIKLNFKPYTLYPIFEKLNMTWKSDHILN
jgi:hypothetical protein